MIPTMASAEQQPESLNIQLLVDSIPALIHTARPDGYLGTEQRMCHRPQDGPEASAILKVLSGYLGCNQHPYKRDAPFGPCAGRGVFLFCDRKNARLLPF
jgi:hypothetical protein